MYIYLSVCPLHDPGLILGRGAEYLKRFVPDSSRAGARRKSPNDAPWETPCQGLVRPISAPLLGVALSWRQGKKLSSKAVNKSSGWSGGCLDYMVNLIKNSCEVSCDPMYRCEPPPWSVGWALGLDLVVGFLVCAPLGIYKKACPRSDLINGASVRTPMLQFMQPGIRRVKDSVG